MSAPPAYEAAVGAATAAVAAAPRAGDASYAAASTSVDNVSMRLPSETLSPTLTFRFAIVPAAGDGTSIVALSDSSVISASSALTLSPTVTSTSITGTFL